MFESILCQLPDHDPDILEFLIGLAVEIAREGQEGRRVGSYSHWGMRMPCSRDPGH
jgi:hypothetical protein